MKFNGSGSLFLYDVVPSIEKMETVVMNRIMRKNKDQLTKIFGTHTFCARQMYATKLFNDGVPEVQD